MTLWQVVCWLLEHDWTYKDGYRVCEECGKIEALPPPRHK